MKDRKCLCRAISLVTCLATAVVLLFLLDLSVHSAGTTRYVATDGTDRGGCTDPANPCRTVQYAVNAGSAGSPSVDEILVAGGLYTGGYGSGSTGQVLRITRPVTVRGGFSAGFAGPPDPKANPTTLDAQGKGTVVLIDGEHQSDRTTLENLNITGGDGGSLAGGIHSSASVDIRSCMIEGNQGGGLGIQAPEAWVHHNVIQDNSGGGLDLLVGVLAVIEGNVIAKNQDYGLRLHTDSPLAYRHVAITENTIESNAGTEGAGIRLEAMDGDVQIRDNSITDNSASGHGSALWMEDSAPLLVNNVIANNESGAQGSAVWMNRSKPTFVQNTIAQNGGDGLHMSAHDGTPLYAIELTNTIIVSHAVGVLAGRGNKASLESTLWEGNEHNTKTTDWFATIISVNDRSGAPAFVAPDADDFHLGPESAAVDLGVDSGVARDMDGEPRPMGVAYDIGADELWVESSSFSRFLPLSVRGVSGHEGELGAEPVAQAGPLR